MFFFLGSVLWCSQNDNHPQEDLARFGYKLNMKFKTAIPPINKQARQHTQHNKAIPMTLRSGVGSVNHLGLGYHLILGLFI
jgi:hypothetical protein